MLVNIKPIACQHIADYYQRLWEGHKCIGFNLLRHGYNQCARGEIEPEVNNLYKFKH